MLGTGRDDTSHSCPGLSRAKMPAFQPVSWQPEQRLLLANSMRSVPKRLVVVSTRSMPVIPVVYLLLPLGASSCVGSASAPKDARPEAAGLLISVTPPADKVVALARCCDAPMSSGVDAASSRRERSKERPSIEAAAGLLLISVPCTSQPWLMPTASGDEEGETVICKTKASRPHVTVGRTTSGGGTSWAATSGNGALRHVGASKADDGPSAPAGAQVGAGRRRDDGPRSGTVEDLRGVAVATEASAGCGVIGEVAVKPPAASEHPGHSVMFPNVTRNPRRGRMEMQIW